MKKNISLLFVGITFLLSWGFWLTLALLTKLEVLKYGQPLAMVLFLLGGLGPIIAAFIVRKKGQERKQWSREVFKLKVSMGWYIYALFIPFILNSIAWVTNYLVKGEFAALTREPLYMMLIYIPVMLIFGGIEEPGWRGVMLPEMMKKYSFTVTVLVMAAVWSLWHYPLWMIEGTTQYGTSFLIFALNTVPLTITLSILYINTRSVFLCALYHSIFNASISIMAFQNTCVKLVGGGVSTEIILDLAIKLGIALVIYLYLNKRTSAAVKSNQAGM